MGELVLAAPTPDDRSPGRYRDGLERFADRDLPERQRAVLERHRGGDPPAPVEPGGADAGAGDRDAGAGHRDAEATDRDAGASDRDHGS